MIAVNGAEIYFELHGQGEPLLLLHGYNGTGHAHWEGYRAELARHFRLITPDLRGHGRSLSPPEAFTHRQAALDMYGLLDFLGVGTFRAMGFSTGGMTLFHMATRQPARVAAMVAIVSTIYFPQGCRQIMAQNAEPLAPEAIAERASVHLRGPEQIRKLHTDFYRMKDSYEDMNFSPPLLSTISARTLIVHGDRDSFFPVEIALQMYRSIGRSYLWVIPHCGHGLPQCLHQAFLDTVLPFLGGQWD